MLFFKTLERPSLILKHYFFIMFLQSHQVLRSHRRRSPKPPLSISKIASIVIRGFSSSPSHVFDGIAGKWLPLSCKHLYWSSSQSHMHIDTFLYHMGVVILAHLCLSLVEVHLSQVRYVYLSYVHFFSNLI